MRALVIESPAFIFVAWLVVNATIRPGLKEHLAVTNGSVDSDD